MRSGPPQDEVTTPTIVLAIAGGRPVRLVWRNEAGGLTYAIDRVFVKWTPRTSAIDPDKERIRLAWASAFTRVPNVLDHGRDGDGAWLVTSALPGENAVSARWTAQPSIAAAAIGAGLRAFHDALPVADCPFSWSIADRLADIHRRAALGMIVPERWHEDHRHLSIDQALEILDSPPPIDRLVVCHGDTCAPNTLVGDDGRCTGHVDLGALGIADRWADLAIATWSTRWNYGSGFEPAVLAAYGIAADDDRTRYYRLLWDLGP